mgnify:CR=1 FL=1
MNSLSLLLHVLDSTMFLITAGLIVVCLYITSVSGQMLVKLYLNWGTPHEWSIGWNGLRCTPFPALKLPQIFREKGPEYPIYYFWVVLGISLLVAITVFALGWWWVRKKPTTKKILFLYASLLLWVEQFDRALLLLLVFLNIFCISCQYLILP